MANENSGSANPTNDDKELLDLEKKQEELDAELQAIEDSDDLDALKEIAREKHENEKKIRDLNKHLFERAKHAEGFDRVDGKWIKREKTAVTEKKPEAKDTDSDTLSREEVVMIAKGTDEEDLSQLKIIQKGMGEGATLKQASESPLYQGYIAQKEAAEKKRKGALGASGGGRASEEDKINKPGLSREEHKALWEEENK